MKAALGWAAFWSGFIALDVWADGHGASLSTTSRRVFRTDTRLGRAAVTGVLVGGSAALWDHIVND